MSVNHGDWCQSRRHSPLCAGWSTPCDLFLDAVSCTQFVREITEGEAGEESRSSVSYLFFISTSLIYRGKQHVKQGIV